jgi:ATP-dependent DNA helicase PIF1
MRQSQALGVMLSGASVFLTGPPGAGKTYVLNEFIRRGERSGKRIAVTASTGIAATHIGGSTIHSWSGLGIRDSLTPYDMEWLKANDRLKKRYNGTDALVIDEVSMLHGKRLDMVNEVCKLLRESDEPFGGLQIILVGDLFQLPPVNRESEVADFVHTSAAWIELAPKICYLSEQHRQSGDRLLDVLEAMRRGEVEDWHTDALMERMGKQPAVGSPVTRLYTHNVDVDKINQQHLIALQGESKRFEMRTEGNATKVEQLVRSVLAPEILELKTGAEVMFVANNFTEGYVNGSRGQVTGFDKESGLPEVRLLSNGKRVSVEYQSWTLMEDGRVRAEVVQLPLRLAWAITIHKSQGMSLDAAEIDLSKSFTPGMGYVALSRVRSLDGVYLSGMNAMAMRLHPEIFDFDEILRAASTALADITVDAPEAEAYDEPAVALADEVLLVKLKQWRALRAQTDRVPAYMIAHDAALEALAAHPVATTQQLLGITGFGPRKVETYGEEILRVVAKHQEASQSTAQTPVRSYRDEDYEQLKNLTEHSEWFGGQFDEARDGRERLRQKITQDPASIFVFQQGEFIVGTISIIDDGRVGMLFRFIVKDHDEAVALALFDRAIAELKVRGHKQVLVYTTKDKALNERYKKLGMYEGGSYVCYWSDISD